MFLHHPLSCLPRLFLSSQPLRTLRLCGECLFCGAGRPHNSLAPGNAPWYTDDASIDPRKRQLSARPRKSREKPPRSQKRKEDAPPGPGNRSQSPARENNSHDMEHISQDREDNCRGFEADTHDPEGNIHDPHAPSHAFQAERRPSNAVRHPTSVSRILVSDGHTSGRGRTIVRNPRAGATILWRASGSRHARRRLVRGRRGFGKW